MAEAASRLKEMEEKEKAALRRKEDEEAVAELDEKMKASAQRLKDMKEQRLKDMKAADEAALAAQGVPKVKLSKEVGYFQNVFCIHMWSFDMN